MEKMKEALRSVLPIAGIVLVLCFSISPVGTDTMLSFIIGCVLLIVGLGLFMYGAENSMTLIGNYIGSRLTASRRLGLILAVSVLIGIIITVAEPDLSVLAGNVPHIDTAVLILTVSVGVGLFLMLSMLRILFAIPLRLLLWMFYGALLILAFVADPSYIAVAFDAGGVTTGPMTAPFIIALGAGVAFIRSDRNAEADSFGLVALCSIGPILAVLLLSFFYVSENGAIAADTAIGYTDTVELSISYLSSLPHYMMEMALALTPVVLFFLVFQVAALHLPRIPFMRIITGLLFTYAGLVVFLTGVNVGFSPMGLILGTAMAQSRIRVLTIPVFALMGWFVVSAEPAVHVLTRQVEEISAGAVSSGSMRLALSAAIALAMALSMIRVLTGISILWMVIPGYLIALILSFFVPSIFTAIAFDSGGVASGPMSATFMLPFAMGVCQAVGGDILTDAFGTVALVAMMPLITIQLMGVRYMLRGGATAEGVLPADDEIVELWEVV